MGSSEGYHATEADGVTERKNSNLDIRDNRKAGKKKEGHHEDSYCHATNRLTVASMGILWATGFDRGRSHLESQNLEGLAK